MQLACIWRPSAITSVSASCLSQPGRRAATEAMLSSTHGGCHSSAARELGFGIEEIQVLLALTVPGNTSCAEVRSLTVAHLGDVRAKISDLRRLERVLARTVRQCSGDEAPPCPVLDMLNEA
jgi:MerR family mercuric resistance operon transcriptional regulator